MITEHMTTVANLETRYLAGGPQDAPPVIFLHDGAWGGSADVTWGHVLPLAAEKFRVIAPDFLGYGGSAKSIRLDVSPFSFRIRHVFALLDELGVDRPVHLVGNSFGGSVALRALTENDFSSRIASATTINGTGGPWRAPAMAKLREFDGTVAGIEALVDLLCDASSERDDQVQARYRWATAPGHFGCMSAPHLQAPEAMRPDRPADPYPAPLAQVDVPVLLIEGTEDVLLERGWGKHLEAELKNSRTETLPYRHCPNITHPAETWAVIDVFLDGQTSEAH
ncbi:alpha/beta fold hydrolase [Saccharopolyspora shandongensis]|uniref:alpha/beta fold hydrolase n=1 Tax=Saccharopolyspora shandongensis TaxID=418495 RepID=UPI0033EC9BB8